MKDMQKSVVLHKKGTNVITQRGNSPTIISCLNKLLKIYIIKKCIWTSPHMDEGCNEQMELIAGSLTDNRTNNWNIIYMTIYQVSVHGFICYYKASHL